ncbi:MAG TPA: twin-arginine translocation signal domain-containing protein [Armatimonadota bacterium]|nr:twin-arginine translocation signal domain-containing protein [Armatimonadota bacterium]
MRNTSQRPDEHRITRRDFVRSAALTAGAVGLAGTMGHAQEADPVAEQGPIRSRFLWTWDHCTTWALNRAGGHDMGASNDYGRTTESFIADYSSALRWCGKHGIEGIVVWGLLRDRHGGLESVKRLCEVAKESGTKLLAGVGLNAYGGVYYEGNSPWSLEQHLKANPELYGIDAKGERMIFDFGFAGQKLCHHACPSRPENQEYAAESLRWLMETTDIDGVQMEAGDTGVCQCPTCKARRRHPVSGFSWEDMALIYAKATEAIRSVRPEATVIVETYSHPQPHENPEEAPGFGGGAPEWAGECLAQFPEGVFVQWVCDQYIAPTRAREWTDAGRPPAGPRRHIMRAHMGTYWHRYRDELAIDWIAEMAGRSATHGFDALSIFGESSPFHAGSELNYLALADYGSDSNPACELSSFLDRVAAPLLGGPERARRFLEIARLIDHREQIPEALADGRRIAADLSGRPAQRWTWLCNYLASFIYPEPPLGDD